MTPELERYLKAATRGLWGKKKLEVREELEAHILERAHKHELLGLEHQQAISNAIQELGDAREMNRGMNEVHTMPTFRFMTFSLTTIALTVVMVSSRPSTAQVSLTNDGPSIPCKDCSYSPLPKMGVDWLSIDSLEQAFKKQDIATKRSKNLLEVLTKNKTYKIEPSMYRNGQQYIVWNKFFWSMVTQAGPNTSIIFTGWKQPQFKLGEVKLNLGTNSEAFHSEDAYGNLLRRFIYFFDFKNSTRAMISGFPNTSSKSQHTFHFDTPDETVYGLVSIDERGNYNYDVAPSRAGITKLYVPQPALRIVNDFGKLSPYRSGGKVNAVLIQFTGIVSSDARSGADYKIVMPSKPESDAVK